MAKAQAQRRQQAIERYLAGDRIEDICRELACSKSWLYKWRDRYQATEPSWSEEQSRSPRTTPTKTPQRIAQVVVAHHGKGCGALPSSKRSHSKGSSLCLHSARSIAFSTAMQRR